MRPGRLTKDLRKARSIPSCRLPTAISGALDRIRPPALRWRGDGSLADRRVAAGHADSNALRGARRDPLDREFRKRLASMQAGSLHLNTYPEVSGQMIFGLTEDRGATVWSGRGPPRKRPCALSQKEPLIVVVGMLLSAPRARPELCTGIGKIRGAGRSCRSAVAMSWPSQALFVAWRRSALMPSSRTVMVRSCSLDKASCSAGGGAC